MALRQIEVVVPEAGIEVSRKLVESDYVHHFWQDSSELQKGYMVKVLVDASNTEQFLDKAEEMFGELEYYRLVMLPVEATLPRLEQDEKDDKEPQPKSENPWEQPLSRVRVSREELYSTISDQVGINWVYLSMVVLSTVVAAFGLIRDNTAVVIGAMVIAPLLAPNVGMALGTVLADWKLGIRSLKTNTVGLVLSLTLSVLLGLALHVDAEVQEIAMRTEVGLSDIVLALAAGAAGVLAYTLGMSAAVVGVMVAVALLPPLAVTGLLLGSGQFDLALMAFLLTMVNVICVNLSAISTFIIQDIRPRTWYKSARAKKANIVAIILWLSLLAALILIIMFL